MFSLDKLPFSLYTMSASVWQPLGRAILIRPPSPLATTPISGCYNPRARSSRHQLITSLIVFVSRAINFNSSTNPPPLAKQIETSNFGRSPTLAPAEQSYRTNLLFPIHWILSSPLACDHIFQRIGRALHQSSGFCHRLNTFWSAHLSLCSQSSRSKCHSTLAMMIRIS